MAAKLMIIWDYDSALGQINSSLPYNFNFNPIYEEIKNVDNILSVAKSLNLKMTFACLGFAAEPGVYPFNISEQIRRIYNEGHEIASHSWKHEWFPYLTDKQIYKSLQRSKYSLEQCLGKTGAVKGFVPPHSRPMSWYKKFSFSLGDRAIYPIHKGGDMGYIIKQLSLLNYQWSRVLKSYKSVLEKIFSNSNQEHVIFKKWEVHYNIICVPQHYVGFDETAQKLLNKAVKENEALVIVGHPAALSRNSVEKAEYFHEFITLVNKLKLNEQVEVMTVSEYIAKNILKDVKIN